MPNSVPASVSVSVDLICLSGVLSISGSTSFLSVCGVALFGPVVSLVVVSISGSTSFLSLGCLSFSGPVLSIFGSLKSPGSTLTV